MYRMCGPSVYNPTGRECCKNDACLTHHPRMPHTELITYHTDTQTENADFQQTTSNKCSQLLATCCNCSVCVLPEPRKLPRSLRENYGRKSNLHKSRTPPCGQVQGRSGRCRQFTPTEITVLHVDARKVTFTEIDYVLPVE